MTQYIVVPTAKGYKAKSAKGNECGVKSRGDQVDQARLPGLLC